MLEKGVDYGPINGSKCVFPAKAWHSPQLPAARLQLLGNRVLPGFPFFLSLSIKCQGSRGSRLETAGPQLCQGLSLKIAARGLCLCLL